MAILKPISKQELQGNFDYYGLMYGFVPIYVGNIKSDAPNIAVRNGWPDWILDFADVVFEVSIVFVQAVKPDYNPEFFFKLTGKIEKIGVYPTPRLSAFSTSNNIVIGDLSNLERLLWLINLGLAQLGLRT
ncbi:hypothetical protein KI655_18740 [Vibrio sp. D404a]|uniref:hypothetical protein n=1 Tax=unclassified Vibrio TaxID=2614977 RepID=UPI00255235D3|nr:MULTISPECIES: hypothetical protein [unclassified Vibrio]MDK9739336.1 hypothetical protein [Vibrio sp. D404a]MDK9797629.1 hypothetical protein [Vibrio sp. D449a]